MKGRASQAAGPKRVAVIGAGVAGLSAAVSLARRGFGPVLIESTSEIGGRCVEFACKGIDQCVRCDVCLGRDLVREVKLLGIERIKNAKVVSLSGKEGAFKLHILVNGSVRRSLKASAVVVATGALPFDPIDDRRLGAGTIKDVVSAYDAELEHARTGRLVVPSSGSPPKGVAFVQCVGSRDERLWTPYCSKVCCKYSLKLAQLLKSSDPDIAILYLFMDWRPVDAGDDIRAWASSQSNVRLVRSRPAEILEGPGGRPMLRYAAPGDLGVVEEEVDLVILTVGLAPAAASKGLAKSMHLDVEESLFIKADNATRETSRKGIYAVGSCAGPKDFRESAKDGEVAASAITRRSGGGR